MTDVPEGFVVLPLHREGDFIDRNGPLFMKRGEDGRLAVGLRMEPRHGNIVGTVHGGFLLTVADTCLPIIVQHDAAIPHFLMTISLTGDFLAGAPIGSWLEGRAELVRQTRNLIFTQGILTADGEPVLRANAIFKRGPDFSTFGVDLFAALGAAPDAPIGARLSDPSNM